MTRPDDSSKELTEQQKRQWRGESAGELVNEQDLCPKCLGSLDTGWECNVCGYDAQHLARKKKGLSK